MHDVSSESSAAAAPVGSSGPARSAGDVAACPIPIPDPGGTTNRRAAEPDADELHLVHLPGRKSGQVTIGHSRLPVTTILELLAAGDTHDVISRAYPAVTPGALRVLDHLRDDLAPESADPHEGDSCADTERRLDDLIGDFNDITMWIARQGIDLRDPAFTGPDGRLDCRLALRRLLNDAAVPGREASPRSWHQLTEQEGGAPNDRWETGWTPATPTTPDVEAPSAAETPGEPR